jgi:hypothetical protein
MTRKQSFLKQFALESPILRGMEGRAGLYYAEATPEWWPEIYLKFIKAREYVINE